MTTHTLFDDARQLLGSTNPDARLQLTHALHTADSIHDFSIPATPQPLCCIDGAVASTQTDALVWITAVAGNSDSNETVHSQAVAPVGASTDRLRSALMALCEMKMALTASQTASTVWIDGGLSTPLISVSTALSDTTLNASAPLDSIMERVDAFNTIDNYITLASSGRLRALPKQDTAHGFSQLWATHLVRDEATKSWIVERTDHSLARAVLHPGQFLAPRPASEALRIKIRHNPDLPPATAHWIEALDPLFARWRAQVHAHVTYGIPTTGTARPLKLEFTTAPDEAPAIIARDCLQTAASHVSGAQIVEPLPQYLVDVAVKRHVTAEMLDLMAQVHQHFDGTHPEAVSSYRT